MGGAPPPLGGSHVTGGQTPWQAPLSRPPVSDRQAGHTELVALLRDVIAEYPEIGGDQILRVVDSAYDMTVECRDGVLVRSCRVSLAEDDTHFAEEHRGGVALPAPGGGQRGRTGEKI